MGEVPGDVSTIGEVSGDTVLLDDGRPHQFHQF